VCFAIWKNAFSLLLFFVFHALLALHFKDDILKAWEGTPITF
jgi:hypothetical protein